MDWQPQLLAPCTMFAPGHDTWSDHSEVSNAGLFLRDGRFPPTSDFDSSTPQSARLNFLGAVLQSQGLPTQSPPFPSYSQVANLHCGLKALPVFCFSRLPSQAFPSTNLLHIQPLEDPD